MIWPILRSFSTSKILIIHSGSKLTFNQSPSSKFYIENISTCPKLKSTKHTKLNLEIQIILVKLQVQSKLIMQIYTLMLKIVECKSLNDFLCLMALSCQVSSQRLLKWEILVSHNVSKTTCQQEQRSNDSLVNFYT